MTTTSRPLPTHHQPCHDLVAENARLRRQRNDARDSITSLCHRLAAAQDLIQRIGTHLGLPAGHLVETLPVLAATVVAQRDQYRALVDGEPDLWEYGMPDGDEPDGMMTFEGRPRIITPRMVRRPLRAVGPWRTARPAESAVEASATPGASERTSETSETDSAGRED